MSMPFYVEINSYFMSNLYLQNFFAKMSILKRRKKRIYFLKNEKTI